MNTSELLIQLSKIENGLEQFSFEELSVSEASDLKKSFESFKNGLENKVFGSPNEETVIIKSTPKAKLNTITEDSLIANVSHEIRTPLNGIVGFIDLLEETKLTKKQTELVNALGLASNNLMAIINELLDFSKLAAGKEHFESIDFNLKSLINELSYLSRTLIVNKNVNFNVIIDNNVPKFICGDPSKLSQVLLNILGNAVKFVEEGEINFNVNLKTIADNNVVINFEIKDTGIGIAEDKLVHIFDSYKQAEVGTQLKYGGSGLGLSIVKQIIEQLGGEIYVSSVLGQGTTFRLEIPYKKITKKPEPLQTTNQTVLQNADALVGTTVLVFEDNELNQKVITTRLQNWGCKCIITDNGIEGLAILDKEPVDLVLMDLRMPEMTGFEISKQIRSSANDRIKDTQIIALSADFSKEDKAQFEILNINDFILKPFRPDNLLQKIVEAKNRANKIENTKKEIAKTPTNTRSKKLNLDIVFKDCMGKIELLDELVFLFKKNIFEFIGETKGCLLNKDYEGVGFTTHKIKSGLRMFKLNSLIEIVEQMELVCKSNKDLKHLTFLYEQFMDEYDKISPILDNEIERLRKN